MTTDFKQHRPGTSKYKVKKTGEEVWLHDLEATPFVERGDLQLLQTNVQTFTHNTGDTIEKLWQEQIAEQVFRRSLLADRRRFELHALGEFVQDIVSKSPNLHPGKTKQQFVREKWGSAWGTSQKAAQAESSGTTGGFGVPWEIAEPVTAGIASASIFRQYGAFSVPTQTDEIIIPNPFSTTTSAGQPNWFGGMAFSWTPEAQTRTETEPALKGTSLKLWELAGYVTASGPIIDDAPALSAYLRKSIPAAVAWQEDYAFINGNGVAQPQGILGASATIKVNRLNPGIIQFSDYASMFSKLTPGSLNHAILLTSPTGLDNLLQLRDGSTRAIAITIGANGQQQFSIGPSRLFVTDQLPALGTLGDLCLIDPRWYLIGDRERENGTLEIAGSIHVKFIQNQLVLRVTRRVDGRPLIDQPITLQDGSTQVSPFVVLN